MLHNKRLKSRIWSLLLVSMVTCMIPFSVHASEYSDSTSVTNQGRIGAVDIELHQSFPEEQVMILPNQEVPLESSVENKGKAAWIRVKLEYPAAQKVGGDVSGEDASVPSADVPLEELDDSLITFAGSDWVKIGPYYYLKESVETGAVVPFTESITFPSDWDNTMTNAKFGIVFTAEAIQERNFEPDFDSEDPWNGAVIEAFDSDDYVPRSERTEQFSVIYKDGAEGLIHLGDDFFSNWGDLMPGDELDGVADITNKMKVPVKIFFSMQNEGDEKLLERIGMTIKNGEDVVYDGPLNGSINPAVLLRQYGTNDSTEFRYHISVPADLDNAYALSDFKILWTFSAEEMVREEPMPKEPEVPVEKVVHKVRTVIEKGVSQIQARIDTGDYSLVVVIGVAGAMVLLLLALAVVSKARGKGGADDA